MFTTDSSFSAISKRNVARKYFFRGFLNHYTHPDGQTIPDSGPCSIRVNSRWSSFDALVKLNSLRLRLARWPLYHNVFGGIFLHFSERCFSYEFLTFSVVFFGRLFLRSFLLTDWVFSAAARRLNSSTGDKGITLPNSPSAHIALLDGISAQKFLSEQVTN